MTHIIKKSDSKILLIKPHVTLYTLLSGFSSKIDKKLTISKSNNSDNKKTGCNFIRKLQPGKHDKNVLAP